jgi:hypothetical protein
MGAWSQDGGHDWKKKRMTPRQLLAPSRTGVEHYDSTGTGLLTGWTAGVTPNDWLHVEVVWLGPRMQPKCRKLGQSFVGRTCRRRGLEHMPIRLSVARVCEVSFAFTF